MYRSVYIYMKGMCFLTGKSLAISTVASDLMGDNFLELFEVVKKS